MAVKEEALEFLGMLPKVNSVNTYGSGFFTQGDSHDIQALDLIVSVDNPNLWHRENYENNPWMYKGSGVHGLFNYAEDASFPRGLGAFFTNYRERDYKLVVVDKRLLYNNLATWEHFSLSGRFQKPMTLLIDNSDGVLPQLMQDNYDSAVRTAALMCPRIPFEERELYETIAELSYLGDVRKLLHCEDPNKIKNIVDGAYDFFRETYGDCDLFDRYDGGYLVRKSVSNLDIVESLPSSLRDYIHEDLSHKQIRKDKKLSPKIHSYFRALDLRDSFEMALRCNETVGPRKTAETVVGKIKKGMQKVKK